MGLGPLELGIILLILLILFGAKKLPDLGKGLGSGMREFKDGIQGDDDKKRAAKPEAIAPPNTPIAPDPLAAPAPEQTPAPAEQPAPQRTEE